MKRVSVSLWTVQEVMKTLEEKRKARGLVYYERRKKQLVSGMFVCVCATFVSWGEFHFSENWRLRVFLVADEDTDATSFTRRLSL